MSAKSVRLVWVELGVHKECELIGVTAARMDLSVLRGLKAEGHCDWGHRPRCLCARDRPEGAGYRRCRTAQRTPVCGTREARALVLRCSESDTGSSAWRESSSRRMGHRSHPEGHESTWRRNSRAESSQRLSHASSSAGCNMPGLRGTRSVVQPGSRNWGGKSVAQQSQPSESPIRK